MDWFKKLLTAAIWISIVQTSQAQQHYNVWFRGTLSVLVGRKFKIDNDFQHRRQNGFDNANLFDKNLMFTFRNWVHYQHNEDVKFSLSPFAYFSNYKIIQKQADENATPNSEIRFSAAVELQHEIFKRFYIIDRNALEYRIFSNSQSDITRFRARLGFRYDFTDKIKLSLFDELLFNLSGTTQHHFFDHDRLGLNLEYKVLPYLKFDIGYIHITRLPLTSTTKLHENNIFLNLTYQLNKLPKHHTDI
ncbi:DUF2490 domain-containing protein [Elizabethkingia anophelis]|uniref:DUF2490 domain-containing protein n=1 Tax=Elizabethkingia anophelis TaxID=1117645 RepID=UPI0012B31E95|nr:DUF2490 domain-containing protein [Elizabethkingia anophelis]QGN24302.1 DUF2490 domain-containing protein [Elizabethkingia anophelis]QNV10943.1 DUF2490 domain-containing protein [Elizabethkingia anophelis]UTF89096.1 DUF2490 domain-containing protein [Elizabethkingia anophelis]UTG00018.1 DUF2490 domain-containing protein [Elizabethkingia anophelis]UTG03733.1 DUF2490 domain-containing protein [Elizabethkingia anophelis]